MKKLIERLHQENCSCVISNNGTVCTFHRRGVSDLYDLLCNEPEFLQGALIADKVVGKAAAALMILGEVKDLYADVISQQALNLLKQTDMRIEYCQSVPHIINRTQTDWCPMEKLCFTEDSPEKIRAIICGFLNSMNIM